MADRTSTFLLVTSVHLSRIEFIQHFFCHLQAFAATSLPKNKRSPDPQDGIQEIQTHSIPQLGLDIAHVWENPLHKGIWDRHTEGSQGVLGQLLIGSFPIFPLVIPDGSPKLCWVGGDLILEHWLLLPRVEKNPLILAFNDIFLSLCQWLQWKILECHSIGLVQDVESRDS